MLDDAYIIHEGNELDTAAMLCLKWFAIYKREPSQKNESQYNLAESEFWKLLNNQLPYIKGQWVLCETNEFRYIRRIG